VPESEQYIQQSIRLAVGTHPDVRLFRNNCGSCIADNGRRVTFGLCPGSSDLIGFRSVTITPNMVGQQLAVFTAVEVKAAKGRPTEQQQKFLALVERHGGIAGIARSVDEARAVLGV